MSHVLGIDTTRVTAEAEFSPGQLGERSDGTIWKYVKLANATAAVTGVAGDVVGYKLAGMASATVVTDNTDSQTKPVGAGVLGAAVVGSITAAEYLWVQVSGPATVNQAIAGSPADGDQLRLKADLALTLASASDDPICAVGDDVSAKSVMCSFPR